MDNDLISRQAAIDALDGICDRECEYPKKQRAVMCAACHLGSAVDAIDELSSAERRGKMDNDLISRQAAIDALDEYIEEYSFDLDENGYHNPKWCAMQEAKMTIQRLPSAERKGHWIGERLIYPSGIITFIYRCSECGCEERHAYEDTKPSKYCPDCGVQMEVE